MGCGVHPERGGGGRGKGVGRGGVKVRPRGGRGGGELQKAARWKVFEDKSSAPVE